MLKVLAKGIYLGFIYLCPGNASLFQGRFQRVLSHSMFRLLTGVDVCASSVDYLCQKLYHDQNDTIAPSTGKDKKNSDSHGNGEKTSTMEAFPDLPRQQQRVTFDAYKISPLLEKYLGGEVPIQGRSILKRTVPVEQCRVGGVNTFRRVSPTLNITEQEEWDRRAEVKMQSHKISMKEKNKFRRQFEALQMEQQKMMNSNRKVLLEYANDLLQKREHQGTLTALSRAS